MSQDKDLGMKTRVNNYLEQMELALQEERNKTHRVSNTLLGPRKSNQEDLIRWQLNLKEDMEYIYHLLKGDVIEEDEHGNIDYVPCKDNDLKPFNEFGVQVIMNRLAFYLNRNTLLSDYDEETIKLKVFDFGNEISDLILCRYKDMMMTTSFEEEFKKEYGVECKKTFNNRYVVEVEENGRKLNIYLGDDVVSLVYSKLADHLYKKIQIYSMIVNELTDTVHSAYLRALNAGERDSLSTSRVVTQNESIGNHPMMNKPDNKKSFWRPSTWM